MSILPGNSKDICRIIGIFEDMKRIAILLVTVLVAACTKAPQLERRYEELPLGAIKPEGWLRETLIRQRDGITKNLDETYPQVVGPDKGYPYVEGLQRGMPLDWWPRIVMLKVLQQYYNATGEQRVLGDISSVEVCVDSSKVGGEFPWTLSDAPDVGDWPNYPLEPCETVDLVPYGCTKLRISEFPVL